MRKNNLSHRIPEGQNPLPFRTERVGVLVYARPWERRMLAALIVALIACAALYVYFVMASIIHASARQELVGKVASLQTSVSTLEAQYLARTQDITESYAHSLGFVTESNPTFITRQSVATLQGAR